ncbi:MAG: hypothetical protein LQ339_008682 [Xanthoria mediterranea]|nr:MAG: hypothetical protein LQ339_008682 [Xanthoria mediterranea]
MASNNTASFLASPSPRCTLVPQEPLLPGVSDNVLAIILPTIVYAVAGAFFHILDTYGIFSNHRIHPSEEELKRNHVTKWECLKSVVRYHIMQISIGLVLNHGSSPAMIGDEACRTHTTALAFRSLRNIVPIFLTTLGIDPKRLSLSTASTSPTFAQFLAGSTSTIPTDTPTSLELALARFTLDYLYPASQYALALVIVDTWIYFTHRLCHVNRTLYRLVHAQHHRLYVSYAYGAVYAHWLESLFLDILSFVIAGEVARLSARQSMVFGTCATIKTISDHCGYVFPWDPTRAVNGNGAVFHDLHHQSWGLKYNFSTYTTFWDNLLGTTWADREAAAKRYQRARDMTNKRGPLTPGTVSVVGIEKAIAEGKGDD